MPTTVAVDAMGGDHAPSVVVEGAVEALRGAEGAEAGLRVLLVGPEAQVREELARHDVDGLPVTLLDAPEVIGMAESPAAAVKAKRRSSIHLGLGAVKEGAADAFVSAGNTGAVMAAAVFGLGRVAGVSRPALPGFFPTPESYCILLDVGANVDCRPEHLVEFAQMGSVYAERVMGRERPTVGLLNVGEEPGKGNETAKAAHELLAALDGLPRSARGLNFVGNVEGRDLMHHAADVVVCDGFVGNVVLKYGESVRTVLPPLLKAEFDRQGLGHDEAALVQKVLGGVMRRFSYEEYGGAPLLGVDGAVLIGHGGSSARAVAQMIRSAAETARSDVRGHIAEALSAP